MATHRSIDVSQQQLLTHVLQQTSSTEEYIYIPLTTTSTHIVIIKNSRYSDQQGQGNHNTIQAFMRSVLNRPIGCGDAVLVEQGIKWKSIISTRINADLPKQTEKESIFKSPHVRHCVDSLLGGGANSFKHVENVLANLVNFHNEGLRSTESTAIGGGGGGFILELNPAIDQPRLRMLGALSAAPFLNNNNRQTFCILHALSTLIVAKQLEGALFGIVLSGGVSVKDVVRVFKKYPLPISRNYEERGGNDGFWGRVFKSKNSGGIKHAMDGWTEWVASLLSIGLSQAEQGEVVALLLAVLVISAVGHSRKRLPPSAKEGNDDLLDDDFLWRVLEGLLGTTATANHNSMVKTGNQLHRLLCSRNVLMRNDLVCTVFLGSEQTQRACLVMAYNLHASVVEWILEKINSGTVLTPPAPRTNVDFGVRLWDAPPLATSLSFDAFMTNYIAEKSRMLFFTIHQFQYNDGQVVDLMVDSSNTSLSVVMDTVHHQMRLDPKPFLTRQNYEVAVMTKWAELNKNAYLKFEAAEISGNDDLVRFGFTIKHYSTQVTYDLYKGRFLHSDTTFGFVDGDVWKYCSDAFKSGNDVANSVLKSAMLQSTVVIYGSGGSYIKNVRFKSVLPKRYNVENDVKLPRTSLGVLEEVVDELLFDIERSEPYWLLETDLNGGNSIVGAESWAFEKLADMRMFEIGLFDGVWRDETCMWMGCKDFMERYSKVVVSGAGPFAAQMVKLAASLNLVKGKDFQVVTAADQVLVKENVVLSLEKSVHGVSLNAVGKSVMPLPDAVKSVVITSQLLPRTVNVPPLPVDVAPQKVQPRVKDSVEWMGTNVDLAEQAETSSRKWWLLIVRCITFVLPEWFLKRSMKSQAKRIAFREKLALCFLIFLLNCFMLLFVVVGQWVLCPSVVDTLTTAYLRMDEISEVRRAFVVRNGYIYDFGGESSEDYNSAKEWFRRDVSPYPRTNEVSFQKCAGLNNEAIRALRESSLTSFNRSTPVSVFAPVFLKDAFFTLPIGNVVYSMSDFKQFTDYSKGGVWVGLGDRIYNVTEYFSKSYAGFFTKESELLLLNYAGGFIPSTIAVETGLTDCLDRLYFVGTLDFRTSSQCIVAMNMSSVLLFFGVCIILFKFVSSVRIAWFDRTSTEHADKHVILFIPCYTEGRESLEKTIQSLTVTDFPDHQKLLFLVCDGMVMGSGNFDPTPVILLELLGIDTQVAPPIVPYLSLGEGRNACNFAQVYNGVYFHQDHKVPVVVVVKVGQPGEANKPGNRGKRDSQLILMKYLNRALQDAPMTPLELELHYTLTKIRNLQPTKFDYIMMVDADTKVDKNSIAELALFLNHDRYSMAVAGVTQVENPFDSWITMTQVYEYFGAQFMSKAFEGLFGAVTCLPGCFSMWKIKDDVRDQPLLISSDIIHYYGVTNVSTLHEKNLLLLGEDRYLTTLMLKNFPGLTTKFAPEAKCMTSVPNKWSVFLSQRRRWNNSTVHNLFELLFVEDLCGACCCNMRFLVFADLFSTLILPGSTVFVFYLIFVLSVSPVVPFAALVMASLIYGIQLLVIITHGDLRNIGWMIVNMLAFPIYWFIVPLVSFYRFDDFSWGSTRQVSTEIGRTTKANDDGDEDTVAAAKLDPSLIALEKWSPEIAESTRWRNPQYGFASKEFNEEAVHKKRARARQSVLPAYLQAFQKAPVSPLSPNLE